MAANWLQRLLTSLRGNSPRTNNPTFEAVMRGEMAMEPEERFHLLEVLDQAGLESTEVEVLTHPAAARLSNYLLLQEGKVVGLHFGRCFFHNLDTLLKLQHLRWITVHHSHIRDLPDLSPLQALETLDLADNKLQGTLTIPALPHLKFLNLLGNPISAVAGLEALPRLQEVRWEKQDAP